MRFLAIDIGGTKIAFAIVSQGKLHQRQQIPTPQTNIRENMHLTLGQIIKDYAGKFDAVAVGSTGIINQGKLTALNPKNLGDLADFPLQACLAHYTNKPIGLINDAQAGGCAEYSLEDPAKVKNFAFITVSTGVGGGLVLNGELFTGLQGVAGHIGHTALSTSGEMCGCGRQGCVEAIASGRAIEARAKKQGMPLSAKEIFERFRQGDKQATQLVKDSAYTIADLIANLVISLNIEKIALGGSVGMAEGYLPLVEERLRTLPTTYACPIQLAQFGANAGLVGASYWLAQQLSKDKK